MAPKSKKEKEGKKKPKVGEKRKRDPAKPKAAPSAYLLYCNAKRELLKAEQPELTFGEVNKQLGALWKNASNEEKEKFGVESAKLKIEKQKEIALYKEKHPCDSDDEHPVKRRKQSKDPNAPKKAISAYFFFQNHIRGDVKADLEKRLDKCTVVDITREIGARWKLLSDEDKQPFVTQASADRTRYEREMAEYAKKPKPAPEPKKKKPAAAPASSASSSSSSSSGSGSDDDSDGSSSSDSDSE